MKAIKFVCSVAIAFLLSSCAGSGDSGSEVCDKPLVKNVIFMIGDGMGLSQVYAAMTQNGSLALEQCTHTGFSKTYSANRYITDSAAGGTALATGSKTNNGMIGMNADSVNVYSVLYDFEQAGRATGFVVTSPVTHATPASFYAHQVSRNMYDEIAVDLVASGVDFFAGGGRSHFIARADSLNLVDSLTARDYRVDLSLDSVVVPVLLPYAGLFADIDMPSATQRGDYLPRLVDVAIKSLSARDNEGFFLMVEGSQIDYKCHGNEGDSAVAEVLDFDRAVQIALDYAKADGNTLVVITADHETGGMTILDGAVGDSVKVTFNTGGHTGIMVPIYTYGPGADRFTGILQNTDIPARIRSLVFGKE